MMDADRKPQDRAYGTETPTRYRPLPAGETVLYLMTDHQRGAAYVQDWTLTPDGEVADVVEVEDLDIDLSRAGEPWDEDNVFAGDGFTVDGAAIEAATAAGYNVDGFAGDNNDVGSAFFLWKAER